MIDRYEIEKYIVALKQCAKEHENDKTPTFNIRVNDLCNDTAKLLESLINKAKVVDPKTRGSFKDNEAWLHTTYECPNCGCTLHLDWHERRNYCPTCGIKLDWSKVDGKE